jgi:Ca2+-binding RTX toxin-like protein
LSGSVFSLTAAYATTVAPRAIRAQRGERNDIAVVASNGRWLIRDRRAPVTGYADCTPITDGVSCPAAASLTVTLGDRDDELNLANDGAAATIDAGPGDDVVLDSPGDDTVDGGTGADRLLSGGGRDTLTFASRKHGVTIDLRTLRTSEHDYIAPFAIVIGGAGDDVIRGAGGGRNHFRGGPGADVINARGGGRDRVECGAGRDRVNADHADSLQRC